MTDNPSKNNIFSFPPWWGWLGVATVFSMPLAVSLPLPFLVKRELRLTAFDPLVWSCALLLLAWWRLGPERRPLQPLVLKWLRCVWPGALLILVGIVSVTQIDILDGKALKLVAKTAFQWGEYLLVAPLVFLTLMENSSWRRRALWGLCGGVIVSIVPIVWLSPLDQVFAGQVHPHAVGGLLGNRHTYGLFMAVALCLLVSWAWQEKRAAGGAASAWWLVPGFLLPFLALYPYSAAATLGAALLGLAIVYQRECRCGFIMLPLFLAWLFWMGDAQEQAGRRAVLVSSVQTFHTVKPPGAILPENLLAMRVYRCSANLNMIAKKPWLGVGWGQYQSQRKKYYGTLNLPEGNTRRQELFDVEADEPFTYSWFFLTASELGLLGLAALSIYLAELLARALGRAGARPCLAASGVIGAVAALLVAGLWTSPMVRGAGPLLGLLLAVSAVVPGPGEGLGTLKFPATEKP